MWTEAQNKKKKEDVLIKEQFLIVLCYRRQVVAV